MIFTVRTVGWHAWLDVSCREVIAHATSYYWDCLFVADDELVTGESEEKVVKNVRQCVQKSLCVSGEHAFLLVAYFSF